MKHPADLPRTARDIIAGVPYLTLATLCEDGVTPWNSPVFTAFDAEYRFFFSTARESQKARNIARSPQTAVVIYDSTAAPGTGLGVYILGSTTLLSDPADVARAYTLLSRRRAPTPMSHPLDDYTGRSPFGLYCFTPEKVLMNTESEQDGYSVDRKVAIDLHAGEHPD